MDQNFKQELAQWPRARIAQLIAEVRPCDIEAAIAREERSLHDLAALLSPHARALLEPMAREAQRLTLTGGLRDSPPACGRGEGRERSCSVGGLVGR